MSRKRWILLLQIVLLTAMVVFLTIEVKSSWAELKPRLEEMDYTHVAAAAAILASYYLIFVIGWVLILRALEMRIGYADALGAEMLSMLAKYIPGGVWTPAARVVATKRIGMPAGPVLASVGYEAGLSADRRRDRVRAVAAVRARRRPAGAAVDDHRRSRRCSWCCCTRASTGRRRTSC